MTALVKAREAASRAAAALADAEAREQAEAEAREQRNAARTAEFWQPGGEGRKLAEQQPQRVVDALRDFRQAVASGDGTQVLTAFLAYRRTEAEAVALTRQAADATRRTVGVGLDERGVTDVQPYAGGRHAFADLLERTVKDVAQGQGSAYAAEHTRSLRDALEPEE